MICDWYNEQIVAAGKQPLLLLLAGLVGGFAAIRTSTRMIRAQVRWWPGNLTAGGVHLHHEFFGVLIMLVTGTLSFTAVPSPWRDVLALCFGIGAGLVLDEYALLLHLRDVYWSREGRTSIDAVIAVTVVTIMLVVSTVPFGLNDVERREATTRWAVVGVVCLNLTLTVVTALKGKPWLALLSVATPFAGVIGAFRLASPTSPWARWRYGSRQMARAAERAAAWSRRKDRLITMLGGVPSSSPHEDWSTQRARAIAHHGAALEQRRASEAAEAMAQIAAFVTEAREAGLPAEPLKAHSYGGRTYRTRLRGWYLNPAHTIAVGEDGKYYSLLVPTSATGWLTGVTVEPQPPRLIVGEGARDGESIPLATLLQRRLSGKP
ncbi:hypothetical protein ACFFX1_01680 [Dactylosporangium sucinum]|uniref:Integral membrane protein n=1 Tax=Dactylosporangium sucinum TaxID=1424081 RepID=A0A917WJ36_9ACTN|nr:hypothetical protein [Dactylosporangium sucinum]GGM08825.1 hypothetical protein GCM10007977_007440 [Dactylosporangium sucinum]